MAHADALHEQRTGQAAVRCIVWSLVEIAIKNGFHLEFGVYKGDFYQSLRGAFNCT